MDRALKERIIGATVLVVVAVLIVPVFLDGPGEEPETIKRPVTLPGQSDQPRKQQTIVLERDRSRPVPNAAPAEAPAEDTSQPDRPLPEPVPAPVTEAQEPPVAEAPAGEESAPAAGKAAPTDSETGLWAVQLGSFSNRENAERLAADLRADGYAAFLSQLDTGGDSLHRVRVGPQKDRDTAEAVAARLVAAGHPGQVVPHP